MTLRRLAPLALACALLLAGCGTQVALSGRAYDEYQKNIKSHMEYWVKDGMTAESRVRDWVACGGQPNGNFHLIVGSVCRERNTTATALG